MRNLLMNGLFALAMAMLAGCVPSLNGLSTGPDSLMTDESIVGTWKHSDQTFAIEKRGDRHYTMTHTDADGRRGRFVARLVQVGDARFIDLVPEPIDRKDVSGFHQAHTFRAHTFYHVVQTEPTLEVRSLDVKWLEGMLKRHPDALAHGFVDDRLVLTASTRSLRDFLESHLDDADAFTKRQTFERVE